MVLGSSENRAVHEAAIAQVVNASGRVKGVAFAVTERHFLTCAHVVNAALGRSQKQVDCPEAAQTVKLALPFLPSVPNVQAKVVYWKAPSDARDASEEDIAALELLDVIPGIRPVTFVDYRAGDRQFSAFGYPEDRPSEKGVWAEGKILETVSLGWVQIQGTYEQGRRVERGFSGTSVWDKDKTHVLGMIVAEYDDDETAKVAYMLSIQTLQPAIWFLQLWHLLSEVPGIFSVGQTVFRACQVPGESPIFSNLSQLLVHLEDVRDRNNLPVWLVKFIARLSLEPSLQTVRDALQSLGRRIDAGFDDHLTAIRQAVQQASSQTTTPYLLFEGNYSGCGRGD